MQLPAQVVAQQRPCAHMPLAHSPPSLPQLAPLGLSPQDPP
jgi:hypothetical protein